MSDDPGKGASTGKEPPEPYPFHAGGHLPQGIPSFGKDYRTDAERAWWEGSAYTLINHVANRQVIPASGDPTLARLIRHVAAPADVSEFSVAALMHTPAN
ncbi:MAG: hypothetical protein ACLQFR_27685 [Streptosporangiaceae bacterium]